MKLLITGCARSGTTLMVHLMQYFYSCKVHIEDERHPLDFVNYNSKDHVLVIKKPYLQKTNIEYFDLRELLNSGWRIIWMIRDGRDVVVSQNHHVNPSRWISTNYEMLKLASNHGILTVRYEDLCTSPVEQMDRIAGFIHQSYQENFTEFYTMMESTPMNEGITPRPIDQNSIGAYKSQPEYIKKINNTQFSKLLNIFGYGM